VWFLDEVTSPCVDGGDPNVNVSNEPMPNGGRINMGAYGDTAYASMSEWPIPDDVSPANRAENVCPGVTITWTSAEAVVDHNVYFGTSLSDVNASATPVETHWGPNNYTPSGLELGMTYYWRIDGINDANVDRPGVGFVWMFTTNDGNAFDPYPANNHTGIPLYAKLSWSMGCTANSHDVYFSTDFNDVYNRTATAFQGNQFETTWDPCGLDYYTWYYWRVDEVNDGNTWEGEVWSFRTQGVIVEPNLILFYEFDETDGNAAADSSGYERDGYVDVAELPNGPNWDPNDGRYGGCLIFDDDTAVIVPETALNSVSSAITVLMWVNGKVGQTADKDMVVFDAGDGEGGEFKLTALVPSGAGDVVWRAGNDSNDALVWDGIDPSWLEGDWHHFAFVKDENAGEMTIYLDAWPATSKSSTTNSLTNITNKPFKIGAYNYHANDYEGKLDDFRVYDRALSYCDFWPCPPDYTCAWGPTPYDGQPDVPPDVVLTWKPGDDAQQRY
jgi:hypothetical protein